MTSWWRAPLLDEHLSHLRTLFKHLIQQGLNVNPAKCQFDVASIDFLSHRLTKEGAVPLLSKVQAVLDFPRMVSVWSLQELVGMVNFYHHFIPGVAGIIRPLYNIRRGRTLTHEVAWSAKGDVALAAAKAALAGAAMLTRRLMQWVSGLRGGTVNEQQLMGPGDLWLSPRPCASTASLTVSVWLCTWPFSTFSPNWRAGNSRPLWITSC